jgi:hypothetical protein
MSLQVYIYNGICWSKGFKRLWSSPILYKFCEAFCLEHSKQPR